MILIKSTEYSNIVVKFEYLWRTILASKKLNNILSVLLQYTLKQTSRLCNQFIVNIKNLVKKYSNN